MNCPKCGNRPLVFTKWLRTLNPFKIECNHCSTQLEGGFVAHLWTLCHFPIGAGLFWIGGRFDQAGLFGSSLGYVGFVVGAAAVVFCTAYVIPYFLLSRCYRIIRTDA